MVWGSPTRLFAVPELEDAVKLVTEPANVTRLGAIGEQRRFAVKSNRVLRALREQGAGKAEAHELALAALAEVGGGAELATSRGSQGGARGEREIESWWVPAEAVHFEAAPREPQPPDVAEDTNPRTSPAGSE